MATEESMAQSFPLANMVPQSGLAFVPARITIISG
jgi:hypothetical protein